jgi:hypothetical protein
MKTLDFTILTGLTKATQYNGQLAQLVKYSSVKGRWQVELLNGKFLSIKESI